MKFRMLAIPRWIRFVTAGLLAAASMSCEEDPDSTEAVGSQARAIATAGAQLIDRSGGRRVARWRALMPLPE